MTNLLRQLLNFISLKWLTKTPVSSPNQTIDSFDDLDLSQNLSLESIDFIIAINENSVIAAKNLATKKNSLIVVDLDHKPQAKNINKPRFKIALTAADLIFSANRKLAAVLELDLKRHIHISRHLNEQIVATKYIDLKKVYHLIDDTQIIMFDAKASTKDSNQAKAQLKRNLKFLAELMSNLPRHVHAIVTGGRQESAIFNNQIKMFQKFNCDSRIHFYVENLEAIKYPIDYKNLDLALILGNQEDYTPAQYYKYLHEELVMFSTPFADANQLISSANIGQILNNQIVDEWLPLVKDFLNLSQSKRDDFADNLKLQKQHINWPREAEHFLSSLLDMIEYDHEHKLNTVIVDLSKDQITERTHNLGYLLVEQSIEVCILAPFLPIIHAPISSNIEYIKVS